MPNFTRHPSYDTNGVKGVLEEAVRRGHIMKWQCETVELVQKWRITLHGGVVIRGYNYDAYLFAAGLAAAMKQNVVKVDLVKH